MRPLCAPTPLRQDPSCRRRITTMHNRPPWPNALAQTLGSAEDVPHGSAKYLIEADYVTADVVRADGGELYGRRG
ncbi:MAG: hypothetical protein R2856_18875 [Caldilineaceae bacterium]